MADIATQFTKYLDAVSPYSKAIVVFILPIYITIGTAFAKAGTWIVDLIPTTDYTNFMMAYIVGGILLFIGLLVGIFTDPERKKED